MASPDTSETGEPIYDPRSNPRRGVRVKPLPRFAHPAFRRLCSDVRVLIQSHLSTWKLADREIHDDKIIHANLIYWSSALRFVNHIEYLGTSNATTRTR